MFLYDLSFSNQQKGSGLIDLVIVPILTGCEAEDADRAVSVSSFSSEANFGQGRSSGSLCCKTLFVFEESLHYHSFCVVRTRF